MIILFTKVISCKTKWSRLFWPTLYVHLDIGIGLLYGWYAGFNVCSCLVFFYISCQLTVSVLQLSKTDMTPYCGGASVTSSISLPVELLTKLTKLSDIGEHVRDIARKVADLKDDPLPVQLNNSVPDYVNIINAHIAMLKRRHWVFVIAGL